MSFVSNTQHQPLILGKTVAHLQIERTHNNTMYKRKTLGLGGQRVGRREIDLLFPQNDNYLTDKPRLLLL